MVNSSGSFKKKLYYTEPNNLDNIFHTDEVEEENYEDDDQEYTDAYSLHKNTVFGLLEPGTFVGLRSSPNAIEPFFITQILSKGLAEKNMINEFDHSVLAGEMYAEVIHLQKLLERKKPVKYQKPKKHQIVFIQTYKIFMTNICMSEDLTQSSEEYYSVFKAAL